MHTYMQTYMHICKCRGIYIYLGCAMVDHVVMRPDCWPTRDWTETMGCKHEHKETGELAQAMRVGACSPTCTRRRTYRHAPRDMDMHMDLHETTNGHTNTHPHTHTHTHTHTQRERERERERERYGEGQHTQSEQTQHGGGGTSDRDHEAAAVMHLQVPQAHYVDTSNACGAL
jgi:hypothetical protein